MTAASSRASTMAALEDACRAEFKRPYSTISDKWCQADDQAARYGITTRRVASHARSRSLANARAALYAEAAAGTVMIEQSRAHGVIRWWPVGMLAKLHAERDAAALVSEAP